MIIAVRSSRSIPRMYGLVLLETQGTTCLLRTSLRAARIPKTQCLMVARSTALSSLEDGVMSGLHGTGRCGNAGRESGPRIPLNGGNFAVRSRLVHMGSHVPEDERDALCEEAKWGEWQR